MIKWYAANKLVLNINKTNRMKFIMNYIPYYALCSGYEDNYIEEVVNIKFLGLQIDNHLNWKKHIEQMIAKISATCGAFRPMVHNSNIVTFISIH
jgi:hypothetical protein